MELDNLYQSSQEISVERTAISRVISDAPALLFSIILTSDDVGSADAQVYDGHSAIGERKLDVGAAKGDSRQLRFDPPAFMQRGIFVVVGANTTSVVVRYQSKRD